MTGKSTFKHDKTTFKVAVYFGKKLNCLHGSRHFKTRNKDFFFISCRKCLPSFHLNESTLEPITLTFNR